MGGAFSQAPVLSLPCCSAYLLPFVPRPIMVALVQRVREASVTVEGEEVAAIGAGLLVLLSVGRGDTEAEADWLVRKCARLRVFSDEEGRMDRALLDTGGEALVVPQFTLHGDVTGGHRPSFTKAAPPARARPLYEHFAAALADRLGRPVPTGVFGAHMDVRLLNEGPVTLWIERTPA